MTIKDIANEAGVSIATVSRAINRPDMVSPEKRKIIEDLIRKYDFTLNASARELVTKNNKSIGLIVSSLTNTYLQNVIDSLIKKLDTFGYNLTISITNNSERREAAFLDIMKERRVAAVILLGSRPMHSRNNDALVELSKSIPVLRIGYSSRKEFYNVNTDDIQGSYIATEYLINLGHKRIAFLNGNDTLDTYYIKQKGYVKAMKDYGLPVEDTYIAHVESDFSGSGGYLGTMEFLSLSEVPTAIVTAGDQFALGAYRAIQSSGLKIAEDISVVGFSGSPLSIGIYPQLTTVSQFGNEVGIESAKMLVDVLENRPVEKTIVFEPKILYRNSCAAPKK